MADEALKPAKMSLMDRVQKLLQNPVTVKELRSRMRGPRAFIVLTIYLALMSAFIWIVYLVYYQATKDTYGPEVSLAGKTVFGAVLAVQVFLIVFVGPAFTAGTISGERERQTYDLLRTTLLPAGALVRGKLLSALSYVMLLVFAAVPLQSLAFLLGGIAWEELIISQLLIIVAAVTYALAGLYASSLMRSTLAASVTTYAIALFLVVGLPILVLFSITFISVIINSPGTPNWVEDVALVVGWYLIPTNLPATLIASEIVLLEEGSLWYYMYSAGRFSLPFISPWLLFLLLYSLLSCLFYWGSVRRVRKIAVR